MLGRKAKNNFTTDFVTAFIQSWESRGSDETTVCSGTLDLLRAYLGERACCVWIKNSASLSKVSERGMVEVFYSKEKEARQAALARAIVSSGSEFDAVAIDSVGTDGEMSLDGFLHVPIKMRDDVTGILSLAVTKKEARDRAFVQALECLARLVGVELQECKNREENMNREMRLKSEVEATTRELEQTNKRLIERVRELKALFAELQEKVKELTFANKAKDEFLSIVSHELRTPLTSLNGFLCVLLDEEAGSVTAEQKRFLTIAKQSADRLNLLISDLLDVSRIESGRLTLEMKDCSLFDIVHKSVQGLKSAAENKGLHLTLSSVPTLPMIWGDPNRLQQVVDNLIMNSIKFTERDGKIEVSTEEKGDFIQVAVRDTGPGIDPEDQKKIFDMFYQAEASLRRATGGAGLGLSIARGIINMHGGQIWVDSEKGKGSTFTFLVPRSRERKAA